jgi:hypothetical protein
LAPYNTHDEIETLTPASNKVHKPLWLIGAIARQCAANFHLHLMERTGAHVLHNNNGSTNPVAAAHAEHRQDRPGGPPELRLCAFGSGKPIEHLCLA